MERDLEGRESSTSPPEETPDATTPPGTGELDEDATRKAEEDLEQAGGGH